MTLIEELLDLEDDLGGTETLLDSRIMNWAADADVIAMDKILCVPLRVFATSRQAGHPNC
jgi:hypothetical protein